MIFAVAAAAATFGVIDFISAPEDSLRGEPARASESEASRERSNTRSESRALMILAVAPAGAFFGVMNTKASESEASRERSKHV